MSKKILIIGSGIAGISSSLKLKSYGLNSMIVYKGNFIGGRISTREIKIESNINDASISKEISLYQKEDIFNYIKKTEDTFKLKQLVSENNAQNKKITDTINYLQQKHKGRV